MPAPVAATEAEDSKFSAKISAAANLDSVPDGIREKVEPEIPGSLSPDLAGPGFEAAAATATGSSGTCWTRSAVEREASSYPGTRISSSSSSCAGLEPVEARAEGRPGKKQKRTMFSLGL